MRFRSNAKRIYISRLGRTVEFKRKHYSTDDPQEIATLRTHPLVEEVEGKRKPEPAEEHEPVVVTGSWLRTASHSTNRKPGPGVVDDDRRAQAPLGEAPPEGQ